MKIPPLQNAYENIKNACDRKLAELYPAALPQDIAARYEKELSFLKDSEYLDDFEIFRLLSAEALKCCTPIHMRGSSMGSLIYYLLGNYCFNPLPAHYYCPHCGYYESVQTHLFGIDLPEKSCPDCGCSILADGYNLPLESAWGNDGKKMLSFDYNVSSEFFPFARRVLESLYPDNELAAWGMFRFDENDSTPYSRDRIIDVYLAGYAILPAGTTISDYPELTSYLENGDPCLTGGSWNLSDNFIKPVRLLPSDYVDTLLKLQRATGVYAHEITTGHLRNITRNHIYHSTVLPRMCGELFCEHQPKTFRDMAALIASTHNTFSRNEPTPGDGNTYHMLNKSEAFRAYPCCTREDFFDYLLESGIERSVAFKLSENIRKGRAHSALYADMFDGLPVPPQLKEVAGYYLYVFPRAHCVEYLLMYARIAYYAGLDRKAFSKIMFKKKL